MNGSTSFMSTQMRDDRHTPALAAELFLRGGHITHVRHHMAWPPPPATFTVTQAGDQQSPFGHIGRGDPTDQRYQQHGALMGTPPQSEGVLLVTDEPATLAGFEGATSQSG